MDKLTDQNIDRATEARILDAAHTVFTKRGTAGARMQEIATEAAVNKALLHYYFRSKEKLAEAVFRRVALQLMPPLIAILSSDLELEEKVERVVHHELDQLSRSPFLPAYLISETSHQPERARHLLSAVMGDPDAIRPRVLEVLLRQISARVEQGRMRPITPDQFFVNLIALCVFPFAARPMLMTLIGTDDAGFAQFIAQRRRDLPQFFLAGLRP